SATESGSTTSVARPIACPSRALPPPKPRSRKNAPQRKNNSVAIASLKKTAASEKLERLFCFRRWQSFLHHTAFFRRDRKRESPARFDQAHRRIERAGECA